MSLALGYNMGATSSRKEEKSGEGLGGLGELVESSEDGELLEAAIEMHDAIVQHKLMEKQKKEMHVNS